MNLLAKFYWMILLFTPYLLALGHVFAFDGSIERFVELIFFLGVDSTFHLL